MSTIDFTVIENQPIKGSYRIKLEDGNIGRAFSFKHPNEDLPAPLLSKIVGKLKGSCAVSDLNVYHFNFFPFGLNNKKYEGQGLGSKIYDALNLEQSVDCPALILARPTAPEGECAKENRIDRLLQKKGFENVEINPDYSLLYKIITQ